MSKVSDAETAKGSVPKGEGKRGILSEEGRFQNLGRDTETVKPTRGPGLGPTGGPGRDIRTELGHRAAATSSSFYCEIFNTIYIS